MKEEGMTSEDKVKVFRTVGIDVKPGEERGKDLRFRWAYRDKGTDLIQSCICLDADMLFTHST
jgi:hypothetical protein